MTALVTPVNPAQETTPTAPMVADPAPALPGTRHSVKAMIARCRRSFWYVGLFSLCTNVLMLALPLYSLQVLDRVMSSHSYETLVMLSLLAFILFVFLGMFTLVRSLVLSRISGWLDAVLSPILLSNAVSRSAVGHVVSAGQQQRDLTTIRSFITTGLVTLYDAPWSIVFLLVIYAVNPVLGFVTMLGSIVLLIMAILAEFITKRPLKAAGVISIHSYGVAEAAGRNAEAIEAMGMMPAITKHWSLANDKNMLLQNVAGNRSNILQMISRTIRLTLQIFITGIGGYMALQNELTVGGMIAGSMLAGRALSPFEASIGVWKSLVAARDSYDRLEQSLGASVHWRGSMALPAPKGRSLSRRAGLPPHRQRQGDFERHQLPHRRG